MVCNLQSTLVTVAAVQDASEWLEYSEGCFVHVVPCINSSATVVKLQAMVDLLDPNGVYFNGRVIAQGAPSSPEDNVTDPVVFKRLMQGLEGREPVLLIVDDSSAVWPYDKRNLFVVERYIYFPSSRKRFGMQGKSLLEIDRCT